MKMKPKYFCHCGASFVTLHGIMKHLNKAPHFMLTGVIHREVLK